MKDLFKFLSFSRINDYLHELLKSIILHYNIWWFNMKFDREVKFSKAYTIDYVPQGYDYPIITFKLNIPADVIDYLRKLDIPQDWEYKRLWMRFLNDFIPFTRGIQLNDEDFDNVAKRAIRSFLFYYDFNRDTYTEENLCILGIVCEKLILAFLKKPEMKTPEKVISFFEELSKASQIENTFEFCFHNPDSKDCYKYDYAQLDEINPVKEFFKCCEQGIKYVDPPNICIQSFDNDIYALRERRRIYCEKHPFRQKHPILKFLFNLFFVKLTYFCIDTKFHISRLFRYIFHKRNMKRS